MQVINDFEPLSSLCLFRLKQDKEFLCLFLYLYVIHSPINLEH